MMGNEIVENKIKEINFLSSFFTVLFYIAFVFINKTDNNILKLLLIFFLILNLALVLWGTYNTITLKNKITNYRNSLISNIVRIIISLVMIYLTS